MRRAVRENLITAALCGAVAMLAGAQLWPRLAVGRGDVHIASPDVTVAIEGAVIHPGSYVLPFGATVGQLIDAAGGFSGDAERSLVNAADPLTTGEMVVVPTAATPDGDPRIDLNAADAVELQRLPGIGPVTAERIIAGRPYARLEDLLAVRGIGPKTLERIAARARL